MTIKQYTKKCGWQIECDLKLCGAMTVDVAFIDKEGKEDETQFDIRAFDRQELSDLFADFCKENKLPRNTVINIIIVQMADTMEELV